MKRFFKIEQASFKLIEIISRFSGRNFKLLDCLNTVYTDIYIIDRHDRLPSFQLYITCSFHENVFNVELET